MSHPRHEGAQKERIGLPSSGLPGLVVTWRRSMVGSVLAAECVTNV